MLSNLFGKKEGNVSEAIFKDKVFLNSTGKIVACLQLATTNNNSIFIAWFAETAATFEKFFNQYNIDVKRLILAAHLDQSLLQNYQPVFVEHYPLHAKELDLVKDWQLTNIPVYSAMDEPLFKHFGSDKMVPLIKLLGFKENESIEHSYVTESIIKGQNKIAAKVLVEQTAASQGDWMKKNMQD
ncbi:hypothetical protein QWZ08_02365 [Ferruginibacter paludis]|uniref:hypothetical protein n=1 Tax=Ferruginibacter paludis TaxID=1310417 RepID=UPI0025B52630|nr:hypothetical protein [Ferruginibacter paludis]MDN3654450.1 hypothetical protein [Ferruginibacter paludis]